MLMKKQNDVSLQRGLPVEIVSDSQHVETVSAETVQFYYYNSGVLTVDAGQAAGVHVVAKLNQGGILDSIGGKIGTYKNTSFVFTTGTILTTEVEFPWDDAEQGDDGTGTGQLDAIVSSFANGEYCIDYRNGIIYGVKATTGTSDTASYKVAMATSGGSSTLPSDVDVKAPTVIVSGTKAVTTSGTAVALGTTLVTKSIYIRAKSTNTGDIYVGDATVDATTNQGIILAANDSVTLDVANRATVYIDAAVNLEGVDYIALS